MICPKCHSTDIQIDNETVITEKSFDPCCGIIGFLINPVFILCGLCGANRKARHTTTFTCKNCGTRL